MSDSLRTEEKESALTFPCVFPIKTLTQGTGLPWPGWCEAAPDFDPAAPEMCASKEGNWLSVIKTVNATSQIVITYRELVAHPMVKIVL